MNRDRLSTVWLAAVLTAAVVGLVHRSATADLFADDRQLASEPAWFQIAAPLWHTAIDGSSSIAHRLTELIDPLTAASWSGDVRALAAVATALSSAVLLVLLSSTGVSLPIAVALSASLASTLLPVSAAVSATYALQVLLGAVMLLTASRPMTKGRRLSVLAACTVLAAMNHASFAAFAAAVWLCVWRDAAADQRRVVAMAAALSVSGALVAAAMLLQSAILNAPAPLVERPTLLALSAGLVTGRFGGRLQPLDVNSVIETTLALIPAPLILCAPLAAIGAVRREQRSLTMTSGLAAIGVGVFAAGSWLPDTAVMLATGKVAVLVLVGFGLTAVAALPWRGSFAVAVAASVMVSANAWFVPGRWTAAASAAQLEGFVDAARGTIGDAVWLADRLAVSRALLFAHPPLVASRIGPNVDLARNIPEDRRILWFGNTSGLRRRGDVTLAPVDLRYQSIDDFLASFREWMWIAVAIRDVPPRGVCRQLLTDLGLESPPDTGVVMVSRIGADSPMVVARDRLELDYGQAIGNGGERTPARFVLASHPTASIAINGDAAMAESAAMAVVIFDPWTGRRAVWKAASCEAAALPPVSDPDLTAAYLIGFGLEENWAQLTPVGAQPVAVPLGDNRWFRTGFHDAETQGVETFRWSSARDATVNVAVTHRQPLRIRMTGILASADKAANAMGLSWNGTVIRPLAPWGGSDDGWTVDAALVKRGPNALTIHVADLISPPSAAEHRDSRLLGVRITRLSIEPVQADANSR